MIKTFQLLAVVSSVSLAAAPCFAADSTERARLAAARAASVDPALAAAAGGADVAVPATPTAAVVRTASSEDGANEPSGVADPRLAGEYALVKISKKRGNFAARGYCPDSIKVVIHNPAESVSVYGKMKNAEDARHDSPDQPGYFYLNGFTVSRWTSDDKYDEVQGRTRETVFNGTHISESESGFMLMIGGFVHNSTVMRLGYFNSDKLILKHSETATALLVLPLSAILPDLYDYACEYRRQ